MFSSNLNSVKYYTCICLQTVTASSAPAVSNGSHKTQSDTKLGLQCRTWSFLQCQRHNESCCCVETIYHGTRNVEKNVNKEQQIHKWNLIQSMEYRCYINHQIFSEWWRYRFFSRQHQTGPDHRLASLGPRIQSSLLESSLSSMESCESEDNKYNKMNTLQAVALEASAFIFYYLESIFWFFKLCWLDDETCLFQTLKLWLVQTEHWWYLSIVVTLV